MSQHLNEGELSSLLPEKTSTTLQYSAHDESTKTLSQGNDLNKCISFHAINYEVMQRKCLKKVMPKIILNNVRYVHMYVQKGFLWNISLAVKTLLS